MTLRHTILRLTSAPLTGPQIRARAMGMWDKVNAAIAHAEEEKPAFAPTPSNESWADSAQRLWMEGGKLVLMLDQEQVTWETDNYNVGGDEPPNFTAKTAEPVCTCEVEYDETEGTYSQLKPNPSCPVPGHGRKGGE